MAAVSKGESLLYKDARSYCARRHMNTMWKSMRVDRRFESLLDKEVYHLDKARSYRSRELDQEQELFLENLTSLFERQCEIAAGKLELEIAEQLLKNQKSSADARLRGSRRKSLKRMKSFTVPIHNVMTESEVHVVPGCEHERRDKSTLGESYRVSSAQSFGRHSRQQFVRGFEDPNDGRKSACCGQDAAPDDNDLRKKNRARVSQIFQTEDQTDHAPSRMSAHESKLIEPLRRPSSRKKSASSRPGADRQQAVSWGKPTSKVPGSHPVGQNAMTTESRKPAWSRHRDNVFGRQPYKPLSATGGGRCSKCEPTIAWEIVPRNKRINKPKTASSKLQSTRFQPGQREKTVDEETLFRKQFLACAMSRFLPISALRGASFGEHDDVRKKMEGRRRCLEELKERHRMKLQNAPPPRRVTMSRASDDGTTTRATTSNYTKTPGNDDQRSSKNDTPGNDNFFGL